MKDYWCIAKIKNKFSFLWIFVILLTSAALSRNCLNFNFNSQIKSYSAASVSSVAKLKVSAFIFDTFHFFPWNVCPVIYCRPCAFIKHTHVILLCQILGKWYRQMEVLWSETVNYERTWIVCWRIESRRNRINSNHTALSTFLLYIHMYVSV